jgi:S-adenosylmethionine/arginine decarboxylase-like enzyme
MAAVTTGTEWLFDAHGCPPERLRDAAALRGLLDSIVARLALTVVGDPLWHTFGGEGGVTGLYLLSESHLTVHTYPEHGCDLSSAGWSRKHFTRSASSCASSREAKHERADRGADERALPRVSKRRLARLGDDLCDCLRALPVRA